jgi:hypothetical protein
MNSIVLYSFILSIISIILGFIALLKQKTYLDAQTSQPIDIEVPIVGRMKANYPALVFVFLGFCLAFYVVHQTLSQTKTDHEKEVAWKITGHLMDPRAQITDWQTGKICFFPDAITASVDKSGRLDISIDLPPGKSFEDQIEHLEYVHTKGSVTILPRKEYKAFMDGRESKLENIMPHARIYKPVAIKRLQDSIESGP